MNGAVSRYILEDPVILRSVEAHVREWFPREACGLLVTGPEQTEGEAPAVFPQVHRMARNLPRISVTKVENLNARDVLRHRVLILSRVGIDFLFPSGPAEEEATS